MNVNAYNIGSFFYVVIDEMYNQQEIEAIQKELVFLELTKKFPTANDTATSGKEVLKFGSGRFLDHIFLDRSVSVILQLNRRLFDPELVNTLKQYNCFYGHITNCDADNTLINFYGNQNFYKPHKDLSTLTALTFFKIGSFSGGDLSFPEYGVEIEPKCGRTVIFPSCVVHGARPVTAEEGSYRVTMAQFLSYKGF